MDWWIYMCYFEWTYLCSQFLANWLFSITLIRILWNIIVKKIYHMMFNLPLSIISQWSSHEGNIKGDQINKPGLRFLPELSLSGPTMFIVLCLLVNTFSMDSVKFLIKQTILDVPPSSRNPLFIFVIVWLFLQEECLCETLL